MRELGRKGKTEGCMNTDTDIKRVFLVEPNLISHLGHMFEYVIFLKKVLTDFGFETIVVGNVTANKEIKKTLPNVWLLISQKVFENLEDKGKSFAANLHRLDSYYQLSGDDLVIIPTAYTNQLSGIKHFLQKKLVDTKFTLLFHQLYRPTENFYTTCSEEFRVDAHKKMTVALKGLPKNVSLWATNEKLKNALCLLSDRDVGILPSPRILKNFQIEPFVKHKNKTSLQLMFLGDNRFEKGLLVLLKTIQEDKKLKYFIQLAPPRCYGKKELAIFRKEVRRVKKFTNVKLKEGVFSEIDFFWHLRQADAIVLPYHPASYDKRISGILIQALTRGIPIVTTKDTWLDKIVSRYECGSTFRHKDNLNENANQLKVAIKQLAKRYSYYKGNALMASRDMIKNNTAEKMIDLIFKKLKE